MIVSIPIDVVAAIYAHEPLTKALVDRLNASASRDALVEEIAAWPYGDG